MSASTRWTIMCLALPVLTLGGAFAWLAADHGTASLWNVIVHESGRYSLRNTILYHAHFLREVPTVFAMALFLVAAYGPHIKWAGSKWRSGVPTAIALGLAVLLVGFSFAMTSREQGAPEAIRNLLQRYTRDGVPHHGSHWRFHQLSSLWFGLTAVAAAWVSWRWFGGPPPAGYEQSVSSARAMKVAAWSYFGVLSVGFGLNLDPFIEPRYIGHQAREILTHGTVTLPLGLGLMAVLARQPAPGNSVRRPHPAVIGGVFAIPLFLAIAMLRNDVMATGQTGLGLPAMIGAHYFEHTLDYILFALLVVGLALLRPRVTALFTRIIGTNTRAPGKRAHR